MLIGIAVLCTWIEAAFTLLEIALGTVSRARLRALVEAGQVQVEAANTNAENQAAAEAGHAGETPRIERVDAGALKVARRANRALRLLERPDRLTLIFITVTSLSLWTASGVLTWQAQRDDWPDWVLPLSLIGVLFVAEVLPLLIAARHSESIALSGAGLAGLASRALWPLAGVLGVLGKGVARLMGAGASVTPQVTEGELRTALQAAEEEGVIESEERAMIEGAMDFREKLVREVMTPRIDIVGIAGDASLAEILRTAMKQGHSRLPIYEGTLDKIIGIVSTKDLLPHLRRTDGATICARDVARPAFFVPETKRIAPTLDTLRRQRSLMAVVVGAEGGTAGLVTLEDLLEEIVGEIQDEYDEEEPSLRVVSRAPKKTGETSDDSDASLNALICDAGVSVRDCGRFWNRSFGETLVLREANGLPAEASLSLAALSLHLFDGVPQEGERVQAGVLAASETPVFLEIVQMDGPRIEEVRLEASQLSEPQA